MPAKNWCMWQCAWHLHKLAWQLPMRMQERVCPASRQTILQWYASNYFTNIAFSIKRIFTVTHFRLTLIFFIKTKLASMVEANFIFYLEGPSDPPPIHCPLLKKYRRGDCHPLPPPPLRHHCEYRRSCFFRRYRWMQKQCNECMRPELPQHRWILQVFLQQKIQIAFRYSWLQW